MEQVLDLINNYLGLLFILLCLGLILFFYFSDPIEILSPVSPVGELATLYRPEGGRFVGDLDLDFDGRKLLFSMPGDNGRWQVFELRADGSGLRQLTGEQPDVDSYDACYLPDDRILFGSTACFQSVPCERRYDEVANLCVMNRDGSGMRRLCFDQDHDLYPSLMSDGRVLYTRWEYTDIAHAFSARLFTMNPDVPEDVTRELVVRKEKDEAVLTCLLCSNEE